MKIRLLAFLSACSLLHGQQPAPPPPSPGGDGGGKTGSSDLSTLPIPEADRKAATELTDAELKSRPVMVSVTPVGEVPPPIVVKGDDGLGKEIYRKPLEYPPVIYHIATEKGSIKLTGAQNQILSFVPVPRRSEFRFSYQVPADIHSSAPPPAGGKEPKLPLAEIGAFPVPPDATHLMVVVWKDASEKLWTSPRFKVLDVSPGKLKSHEAIVVNASGRDLAMQRGEVAPYKIPGGYMGKVALPVNAKGQVPMVVSAAAGQKVQSLSRSVMNTNQEDRIFVCAWPVPPSRAQPAGVGFQALARRLPEPKPFAQQ